VLGPHYPSCRVSAPPNMRYSVLRWNFMDFGHDLNRYKLVNLITIHLLSLVGVVGYHVGLISCTMTTLGVEIPRSPVRIWHGTFLFALCVTVRCACLSKHSMVSLPDMFWSELVQLSTSLRQRGVLWSKHLLLFVNSTSRAKETK
jgi:hypothetical protein